jgi:hypothetical protein
MIAGCPGRRRPHPRAGGRHAAGRAGAAGGCRPGGVAAGLQPGHPGLALQQLPRVARNGAKLQAPPFGLGLEGSVGGHPHLVAGLAPPIGQGQVGCTSPRGPTVTMVTCAAGAFLRRPAARQGCGSAQITTFVTELPVAGQAGGRSAVRWALRPMTPTASRPRRPRRGWASNRTVMRVPSGTGSTDQVPWKARSSCRSGKG